MTDMICRKTMTRCKTLGMCSTHGGCRDDRDATIAARDARISELEKIARRYFWIAENADVDCRGHVPDGDYASLDERIDAALSLEPSHG